MSKTTNRIRVLVACEMSGRVRDAFCRRGFDAWSCDLLPSETPGQHYQRDVRDVLGLGWDLLIAHPPCDYMANSGVRWLWNGTEKNEPRWKLMREACEFFRLMLDADIPCVCVENPIMHRHAKQIIGVQQTQVIQPWMFGDGFTKATCLWLRNLPNLAPTKIVDGRIPQVHHESPGPNRKTNRSRTYPGIAEAMAIQWGDYLLSQQKAAL